MAQALHLFFITGREAPLASQRLTAAYIRAFTFGQWAHVCLGERHCVLDPSQWGDRYWPVTTFLASYPSLGCMVTVLVPEVVELDSETDRSSRNPIGTLARMLTGWRRRDCLSRVCGVLSASGLRLDRTFRRPETLRRWLLEQGAEIFWFDSQDSA